LTALPPVARPGKKYVELYGGNIQRDLRNLKKRLYRRLLDLLAEVLSHAVFAEPTIKRPGIL